MRAVAYDAFGATPAVTTLPDPVPAPHGAVVRVEATGLCRSDWHGWMGHDPDIKAFPHVPGHELAGVVEAVGRDVRSWRAGDRVTVPFVCACGTCPPCLAGEHQVCDRQTQPGFTHWGSFAELVALDWADVNLVALPEDLGYVEAAALGCRVATAYRAVVQVGRVAAGERVAVHGCGGVGLAAVLVAVAAGARVVAVDPSPEARAAAARAGAEEVLAPGEDLRDVHLGIEAIGDEAAVAASLAGLRKRGRHVQVGLLPQGARVPMDLVIARELEVLGSHGMAAHAYPELLALRLPVADLVRREIALEEAADALVEMRGPGITVIRPRAPR